VVVTLFVVPLALCVGRPAKAYPWPVKPFDKPHALRGAFDDPRYHLGAEGALSAFHFGVDIAVRDGTPVYAVAPGFVRRNNADVTVRRPNGRAFGYWHIRPVVRAGRHVRLHQLLGYVLPRWGHVHFAESFLGSYRNPLRHGALTPFRDRTPPTVASIRLLSPDGRALDLGHVTGSFDAVAEIYDAPPVAPRTPWDVARLTPALIWWRLVRGTDALTDWNLVADFHFALMPAGLYGFLYAPGTYQNKPHRPGSYLFWLTHAFDTTSYPDGGYQLQVLAEDTRYNLGSGNVDFTIANGAPPVPTDLAPGMQSPLRQPY
jgi:murein DD-endopeptidase MepM/ murein hydrolase activator NlpD